jgi:hypothetical protein
MSVAHEIELSSYETVATLGTNPDFETFQAIDKTSALAWTLKFTHRPIAQSPELTSSLDALIALSHPALLPYCGYCLPNADHSLVVMREFTAQGSLFELLTSDQSISVEARVTILFGVAEGMRYLESYGMAHEALTLNNVLLDNEFEPVLADYGLGAFRTETRLVNDVVSYGQIAISILTGTIEPVEDLTQIRWPMLVPLRLRTLILNCCSADEKERPSFEAIVLEYLTTSMMVHMLGDAVETFQDYQAKVLHPIFSTTVLLAMLDELDETRRLHTDLLAAVDSLSRRVKKLERDSTGQPQRRTRTLPPLPLASVVPSGPVERSPVAPRKLEIPRIPHTPLVDGDDGDAQQARRSIPKAIDAVSPPSHDREGATYSSSSQLPGKSVPFLYRPFDGIFSSLTREYNGNLVDLGIITITGNSLQETHSSDLRRLIDYDWTGCWISADVPNSCLEIGFGYRTFIVTHYTLRTYKSAKGYSHLKSWDLDGIMSGKPSLKLDSRRDTDELNGRGRAHTYQCRSPSPCQGMRLTQTGPNHHGDHYLILRSIEIFGEVLT